MIINIEKLLNEQEEKEFDLGKALRTDKFNIIFCADNDFDEVLNEYLDIYKSDNPNIKLMIRCKKEPSSPEEHAITCKIDFPRAPRHDGKAGIPILFKNGDWFVALGRSKSHITKTREYTDLINSKKEVKKFLNAVAKNIGSEIEEYIGLDFYENRQRLDEIVNSIRKKYEVDYHDE